ncbi:pentatricopeptide repeat-containing protein At4g39530-like [Wolffia australiana]
MVTDCCQSLVTAVSVVEPVGRTVSSKRPPISFSVHTCFRPVCKSHSLAFESNVLLSAIAKKSSLDRTLRFFFTLRDRDTITWNTAISACLKHGHPQAALQLFVEMLTSSKYPPDCITIRAVLRACADTDYSNFASQIHGYVAKVGEFSEHDLRIIYTCLVGLYWEQGEVELARALFDEMPEKDIVAYAAMMTILNRAGDYKQALEIFVGMFGRDNAPMINGHALSAALHASALLHCESSGKQIHAHAVKLSLGSDCVVGTALVDIYAKCGDLGTAESILLSIYEPNACSWNAFLEGCSEGSHQTLRLFFRMRLAGVPPDETTLAIILRACKDSTLRTVQQIHGLIIKELRGRTDSFISTALFQNYLACGCFHQACRVFDEICEKDSVDFNLGISEFAQRGYLEEAIELMFESIEVKCGLDGGAISPLVSAVRDLNLGKQLHGLATKFGIEAECNELIRSALMSMYLRFRHPKEAMQLFRAIDIPDLVSWTSLISGLCDNGKSWDGLSLYFRMVSSGSLPHPNGHTFSCLFRACSDLLAMEEGKQIHAQMVKSPPSLADLYVMSSLLDMYAKCGHIAEAKAIFKSTVQPDLAMWNAMIHALARHGFAHEAIDLFNGLMGQKGLKPNHVTFLGILSACNHGGLVEEGYRWFSCIEEPSVDHYSCMINTVARAGRIKEAMGLIRDMPFEPNEHIWASMLAASCVHNDHDLAQYSAEKLLKLNPSDPGAYAALSNAYAARRQWGEVKRLRKVMKEQGIRKEPGLSWLRVNKETIVFVADKDPVQ